VIVCRTHLRAGRQRTGAHGARVANRRLTSPCPLPGGSAPGPPPNRRTVHAPVGARRHSLRNDSIGSTLDARRAGT